eukprot:Hpha_TRINITY_DN18070_c0_g1::TRINITY_DN18070_c0_g1_i1::g.1215::m.1215
MRALPARPDELELLFELTVPESVADEVRKRLRECHFDFNETARAHAALVRSKRNATRTAPRKTPLVSPSRRGDDPGERWGAPSRLSTPFPVVIRTPRSLPVLDAPFQSPPSVVPPLTSPP